MPEPEPYTHNFKYYIGDGGKWIEGECEFNKDKEASFKINNWSIPLEKSALAYFQELMDLLEKIFLKSGGIQKIIIKKKEI